MLVWPSVHATKGDIRSANRTEEINALSGKSQIKWIKRGYINVICIFWNAFYQGKSKYVCSGLLPQGIQPGKVVLKISIIIFANNFREVQAYEMNWSAEINIPSQLCIIESSKSKGQG